MSETFAKFVFRVPCPEKDEKKSMTCELKSLEDKFYLESLQFQYSKGSVYFYFQQVKLRKCHSAKVK